ncbi:MAG: lipopolysaccharide biosynthesis protein [Bacteroidetes bacterium]|nr:lipopolysaccharide biosynthesis protein [Bacteroidota bacterium]
MAYGNNKFLYYLKGVLGELLPDEFYARRLEDILKSFDGFSPQTIGDRLHYYNKLAGFSMDLGNEPLALSELRRPVKGKVYYFDFREYARCFDQRLKAIWRFGDITDVPAYPSLVKSRPVDGENQNSVLLKWNKVRHFQYISDPVPFEKKEDKLVGMAMVKVPHRVRFYEQYFDHPLCELGQINQGTDHDQWIKPRMTIRNHLNYKFILCLEGYDVASNLKWVMSSGSLAVMPKPRYETWFMEGRLIPDVHYILLKDDYSDLEEKLRFYSDHPDEAKRMVQNANRYVEQFRNEKLEALLSILVMGKYFQSTGQQTMLPTALQEILFKF